MLSEVQNTIWQHILCSVPHIKLLTQKYKTQNYTKNSNLRSFYDGCCFTERLRLYE